MSVPWADLPPTILGLAVAILWLLPMAAVGFVLTRGFELGPLRRGFLWRFRWANGIFVAVVALSTALSIGVIAQERALRIGAADAAAKFGIVVSAPGSELTMLLAAVYLQPSNVPLLNGDIYARIASHPQVAIAAPIAFGDSHEGAPVVGTIAAFVSHLGGGALEGRGFARSGEAVIGAAIALEIGDTFTPAHGHGASADKDAHDGFDITVVGRMPTTGSPWDRAILIPVETVWEVHGLANGHALDEGDRIGPPFVPELFPGTPAVIVQTKEFWANYPLRAEFNRAGETMAFFPGTVLAGLYRVLGDVRQVMSMLLGISQALIAISVLLGLFILSFVFQRDLAILRALGAPLRFVVALVWSYATTLLALGTALGGLLGIGAAWGLGRVITAETDITVSVTVGWPETHLALAFLTAASLLALIPAWLTQLRPLVEALRT